MDDPTTRTTLKQLGAAFRARRLPALIPAQGAEATQAPKPGSRATVPSRRDMRGLWIHMHEDADQTEYEAWLAIQGAKRVGNTVVLPPRAPDATQGTSRSPQLQVLEEIHTELRALRKDLTGCCRDDDRIRS